MNQARHIAALGTVAIAALVWLWLCLSHLSLSPDKEWPPQPDPYIELAQVEDLVETIQLPPTSVPSHQQQDAAAQTPEDIDNPARLAPETGTALEDHGPEGKPAPVMTSSRPSDIQVENKQQPERTGTPADNKRKEEQPRHAAPNRRWAMLSPTLGTTPTTATVTPAMPGVLMGIRLRPVRPIRGHRLWVSTTDAFPADGVSRDIQIKYLPIKLEA